MKAKLGDIEVEGTSEEIAALIRALHPSLHSGSGAASEKEGRSFVSEDLAFRTLKRRPLSKEQGLVLGLLKRNHPSWTSAFDLQNETKYSGSQLAGLLGAFGKRVTSTEGYRAGTWFFDQQWDYERDCNVYRLPESVLAAVRRAGI